MGIPGYKVAIIAYTGASLLFVLTHQLRKIAHRRKWFGLGFGPLIVRLLIATFLLSVLSQLILSGLLFWPVNAVSPDRPYSFGYLAIYIFQTQIILLLWSLAFFSYHAIRNYKSEEVQRWKLEASMKGAELAALKAQINPHFIFNCLNNIRALVLEDPSVARDAITRLSDLLRSSIQINKSEKVSLGAELEIVRDYLALEKIHMEDRLRYTTTIPDEVQNCLLPPMAVQLLVENAIKHCLAKQANGGNITIEANLAGELLRIQVSNTGQIESVPHHQSQGTQTGLSNLRDRLQLLSGPDASLTLQNEGPRRVVATLTLPIERAPRGYA